MVLPLDTDAKVFEKTTLSAARQMIGEVHDPGRLVSVGCGLPEDHRLIQAASVEIGADRALKFVDEAEVLLIRGTKINATVPVLDVTVE